MYHITRRHISSARALLGRGIIHTPVFQLPAISNLLYDQLRQKRKVETFFKLENLQSSGSFKFRGALHSLRKLSSEQLQKGVITHSTGNHALALCMAAKNLELENKFDIPVTVVVSQLINPAKLAKLQSTAATIVTAQQSDPAAVIEETAGISKATGAAYVPPADHENIVLGQATCIAEFSDQLKEMGVPKLDAVILPSGGGGLLTGAALYHKGNDVNVFGAEPSEGGPRLGESLRRGTRLEREPTATTIADGLRTSVGKHNWQVLRSKDYISGVLAAKEDKIVEMQQLLRDSTGMSIEPSAAVGIAAAASDDNLELISDMCTGETLRLGFVVTGGNAL